MLLIGHRGERTGVRPENSIEAFTHALEGGADGIECDIHTTADGTPVLYHDPALPLHLGEGGKRIRTITRAALLQHAPSVVTLSRFAAWLHACTRPFFLNLEVKDAPSVPPATHLLQSLLRQGWPSSLLLISSFDARALARAREEAPEVPRALIAEGFVPTLPAAAEELACCALVLYGEWFDASCAAAIPSSLAVFVWPVNTPDEVARLAKLGVDAVVSDDPVRLRAAVPRERADASLPMA